jgi:hypothetical protein
MSCPFCQNPTPSNKVYCSSRCARLVLAAVKESNDDDHPQQYAKPSFQKPSFQKPYVRSEPSNFEPVAYTKNRNYEMNVDEKSSTRDQSNGNISAAVNRTPYQELLKQNQESVANNTVSNKCKNQRCSNQITGNDLYCNTCDNSEDTKCKKCGVNDRNVPHPICTECHKLMKDKPKENKDKTKYDKKDKSKYDKKDKSKKV